MRVESLRMRSDVGKDAIEAGSVLSLCVRQKGLLSFLAGVLERSMQVLRYIGILLLKRGLPRTPGALPLEVQFEDVRRERATRRGWSAM